LGLDLVAGLAPCGTTVDEAFPFGAPGLMFILGGELMLLLLDSQIIF
jgi:hypothetical protein